jgi:hypothetical protein
MDAGTWAYVNSLASRHFCFDSFPSFKPFNRDDSLTDPDKMDTTQQSEWVLITL